MFISFVSFSCSPLLGGWGEYVRRGRSPGPTERAEIVVVNGPLAGTTNRRWMT